MLGSFLNLIRRKNSAHWRKSARPARRVRLEAERLEERLVPALTYVPNVAGSTAKAPYNGIVALQVQWSDDPGIGFGTGAFIDANHILTAAHVLYDPNSKVNQGYPTQVDVLVGRDISYASYDGNNYGGQEWANIPQQYIDAANKFGPAGAVGCHDIAVLTVSSWPAHYNFGVYPNSLSPPNGPVDYSRLQLWSLGYPVASSGTDAPFMYQTTGYANGVDTAAKDGTPLLSWQNYGNNATGLSLFLGGQSGSPVFAQDPNGGFDIVGVFVGHNGNTGKGFAVAIDPNAFAFLKDALNDNPGSGSGGLGNDGTATYSYDRGFAGQGLGQSRINPTTSNLFAANRTALVNGPLTFYDTVKSTADTPTGYVNFYDGTNFLGAANLIHGQAVFTTSSLGIGAHSITGIYEGDGSNAPGTSQALAVYVVPPPPVLTTPSEQGTIFATTATFQWQPVPGAPAYELEVYDTAVSNTQPVLMVPNITGTSYAADMPYNGHTYQWSVASQSGVGPSSVLGSWAPWQLFSVVAYAPPTGLTPGNGGVAFTAEPTLRWSGVGANQYGMLLWDVAAPGVPIINDLEISNNSYTPSISLLFGHEYDWYVWPVVQGSGSDSGGLLFGPASAITSFFVSQVGLPTPATPTGNATVFTTSPVLSWSAATNATGYNLTIYDVTAQATLYGSYQVPGTSYLPSPPFLPGHTYTWSVQGFDNQGNTSPAVGTDFTVAATAGSNAPLPAPTLAGPTGYLGGALQPNFTWSTVAGATSYYLYLEDTHRQQMTVYAIPAGSGNAQAFTPPAALAPADTYQWWVIAWDNAGEVSPAPSALSFTPGLAQPVLSGPLGSVTTYYPTFTWQPVLGASLYDLSVIDQTGNQGYRITLGGNTTSYQNPVPLTDGHSYSWQVVASATGASSYPGTGSFTVAVPGGGTNPLAAPVLIGPSACLTSNPTVFQWSPVPGATGYGLYVFDLTTKSLYAQPVDVEGATSFQMLLNQGDTYSWYVTAHDGSGDTSNPSARVIFQAGVPATHGAPAIVGPTGTYGTYIATFQWTAVSGASAYHLMVIDTTLGDQPILSVGTISGGLTSYTDPFAFPLNNGDTYQWYVWADVEVPIIGFGGPGRGGSSGPTFYLAPSGTATGTFTVSVPPLAAPMLSSPGPKAVVNTLSPTMTWSAVSVPPGCQLSGYQLTYADAGPGSTQGALFFSNAPVTSNTSYTFANPLANGHTYEWSVYALFVEDGITFMGPASGTGQFTVSMVGAPAAQPMAATVNTATPTLQWSAAANATYYSVSITDTTSNATWASAAVAGTSYTLAVPLASGDTYQWSVQAFDDTGNFSAPSQSLNFGVSVPSLGTSTLTGPSGIVTTGTPTLTWSAVPGALGYSLFLQDTTTNSLVLNGVAVGTTSYTPGAALTDGDNYTWYVQANDGSGNTSPSSQALGFTVALPPVQVGVPSEIAPTANVTTSTPSFQWTQVPGAVGYQLQILDMTTNTAGASIQVAGTSFTPTSPLTYGDNYEWEVMAYDGAGNQSAWSMLSSFTCAASLSQSRITAEPANIQAGGTLTITLTTKDNSGTALSSGGLAVGFGVASGSGAFGPVTDNGDGTYSASFTATKAGSYTFTASINGQPVSSAAPTVTVHAGSPARITTSSGDGQSATTNANFALPLVATVTDTFGNPVPGATVTFAGPISGPSAAIANPMTTTDANGQASEAATANSLSGSYQFMASVTGVATPAVFSLTNVFVPAHISGTVFNDVNGNGVQELGELGLSGQTLFLDLDGSGVFKPSDPTAVTDSNGNFLFTLRTAGTYTVKQVLPGGVLLSAPAGNSYQVIIASGANLGGVNFGNVLTSSVVPLALPLSGAFPAQGDANADFVERVYRAILQRNAEPGGLSTWTTVLNNHRFSRFQVVQAIWSSPEHYGDEIDAFYQTLLQRQENAADRANWVRALQSGTTEEQVAMAFLDSPEYRSKGDKYFVDFMYQSVLGRQLDPQGEGDWLNALGDDAAGNPTHLPTMHREDVISGFLNSDESKRRLIEGDYEVFLQRSADGAGMSNWLNQLSPVVPLRTIAEGFMASDEYFYRAAANG
jgi:hypothetical protein